MDKSLVALYQKITETEESYGQATKVWKQRHKVLLLPLSSRSLLPLVNSQGKEVAFRAELQILRELLNGLVLENLKLLPDTLQEKAVEESNQLVIDCICEFLSRSLAQRCHQIVLSAVLNSLIPVIRFWVEKCSDQLLFHCEPVCLEFWFWEFLTCLFTIHVCIRSYAV